MTQRQVEGAVEGYYPYVGGVVLALAIWYFQQHLYMPETLKELFPVVISICAIAVGFLATVKSILLAIEHRPVIQHLKDMGGYDTLVSYLMSAVHWCLFASLISAIALLLLDCKGTWWFKLGLIGWAGTTAVAILTCYRVLRLFGKILLGPKGETIRVKPGPGTSV